MKLINFSEQTTIYAENQLEYLPLPAHQFHDKQGRIAFCWKLTWKERVLVLLYGTLWQQVLTFENPLQPQLLSTKKPSMGK